MAYYIDSSFDLDAYQPSSNLDDPSSFLGAADFDLDAAIFSDPGPIPTRTTGPAGASSSSSNYTHFTDPLQSLGGPTPLNSSNSPSSFPLFDPDSPFTASAGSPYPIKSLTRDGRLKTKLMGIGSDGGFLTSPLIVGNPRVDSRTGRVAAPEIAIDSPVPPVRMALQSSLMTPAASFAGSARTGRTAASDMAPSLSNGSTASSTGFMAASEPLASASMSASNSCTGATSHMAVSSEPTGLGMGISGMPDLQVSMELGGGFDGEDAALRSFGMTRAPPTIQQGYATPSSYEPTPRHMRSATHGGPLPRFVEYSHVPPSPPPQLPPAAHRPTRTLPSRTINKAKSCSALAASAREQSRATPYAYEPLTPASAHQASFPHESSAPYDGEGTIAQSANHGLLSFSDLYNFDGAAQMGDNVKQDGLGFDGAVDLSGIGIASTDPGMLAPHYDPPSAVSSPSTPYLSDPSPDSGVNYQSLDELSSSAMLAASSVESAFSACSGSVFTGRQRSMFAPTSGRYDGEGELVDPNLLSPQHQPRQRQLSMNAVYGPGARNYSYPTRYTAPQEPIPWSASSQGAHHAPPPMPPVPTTPRHREHPNPNHYRAHTGPAASRMIDYSMPPMPPMPPNMFMANNLQDDYDRKMAQFDSLYDPLEDQPQLQSHAKRARDDEYHDSTEPIATSPEFEEGGARTTKRLRTVASAPCLPARRLRPGPRPKGNKSPAEQHQSMFSATLSPPVPQIRRATSPFSSPMLSDDEEGGRFPDRDANGNPATAATITYVPGPPALPGQPRSSVPKDVIQSLYSGIPGHTTPQGVKVPKRYVCLIEGCERGFPRKSAIESHIQTHLEDKPFVCPHDDCGASFVRQHDLRRHERIHSGNKPFPCPCGKGFARGDALARHRARGICSGAVPLGRH
ncbi:hypothetical protein JCM3770_006135 [Rhodotorula araucariae]